MKKILFSTLALAALTAMTSCSSDEPAMADGNVTFSVELPSLISTRAYSDGLTARHLQYFVYDEDTKAASPLLTGEATFSDRKATISLDLVKGKKYSIVFWADKAGNSFYTYDPATKEVTVDYSGDAQNEDRDAFYAAEPEFLVNGAVDKTITLTRPFAQVNVGTSDWAVAEAQGMGLTKTGMTVTGVNNKINLATGATSGDVTVTYTPAALPGTDEAFPYEPDTYKYLAMNYLLVPGEKTTVDVAVQMTAAQPQENMTFTAVPVQRNYRTNIFGALLTNPANFNVIIDQEYEKPDYNVETQAGNTAELIAGLDKGGYITLTGNISSSTNAGYTFLAKKNTVVDLNGKTLKVTKKEGTGNIWAFAAFTPGTTLEFRNGTPDLSDAGGMSCYDSNTTIKLDNVNLISKKNGNVCAIMAQQSKTGIKIEVKNSVIDAGSFGIFTNASTADANPDILVDNTTIRAEHTPVIINVPGNLVIRDSQLEANDPGTAPADLVGSQALIVRGGTATVSNTTMTVNTDNWKEDYLTAYLSGNWKSGRLVPNAAVVLGNRSASAYQYPTVANFTGVKIQLTGKYASQVPAVYGYAFYGNNPQQVTFNYDATSTIGKMVWGEGNIVVNGKAQN